MNYFEQKTVIIVGASSGIGLATASLLTDKGAKVISISRRVCPDRRVISEIADVADQKYHEKITAINEREEKIDAVIYSAGFSMAAPVKYVKAEDYRYLYDVNLFGFIETVKVFMDKVSLRKGAFVAVSSMGGIVPIAFDSFYSSSKAALNMFVRAVNLELKPINVRVLTVSPGGTNTDFSYKRKIYGEEETGEYSEKTDSAVQSLRRIEQSGDNAVIVAQTIINSISKKNLFSYDRASGGMNKMLKALVKIMPDRLINALCKFTYNL